MADAAGAGRRFGWRFWGFTGFMLVLMALFVGLGVWQLQRLVEKQQLVASVADRFDAPPVELAPVAEWNALDADAMDYRPVTVTGTYMPEATVLVFTSLGAAKGKFSGPGYWVMTPLRVVDGGMLFVNRGFVPQASGQAFAGGGPIEGGLITLTGVARRSEPVGGFTPDQDTAHRIDWVRNVERLAALAGRLEPPIAPIYVDLPAGPAGALPQGGETVIEFPNNHLGYIFTWFGFAALVPVLLWFWIRRQQPKP